MRLTLLFGLLFLFGIAIAQQCTPENDIQRQIPNNYGYRPGKKKESIISFIFYCFRILIKFKFKFVHLFCIEKVIFKQFGLSFFFFFNKIEMKISMSSFLVFSINLIIRFVSFENKMKKHKNAKKCLKEKKKKKDKIMRIQFDLIFEWIF